MGALRSWLTVFAATLVAASSFACGAAPSAPASKPRSSDRTASAGKDCSRTCDPHGSGNAYMDAAYARTYEPCLQEAVRQGTTVQALGCSAKATETCLALCKADP